jgi:hypothetical protein
VIPSKNRRIAVKAVIYKIRSSYNVRLKFEFGLDELKGFFFGRLSNVWIMKLRITTTASGENRYRSEKID